MTPAEIVTVMRDRSPLEVRDDLAEPVEGSNGGGLRRVRQDQKKLLAAIAAEFVDPADVGEHRDRECSESFVAGRMTECVVYFLEPVEIYKRTEQG